MWECRGRLFSSLRCSGFYHLPRGYFSTHDPLSSVSFLFLWPNSADNGSADTVVGKITALHFSSVSLFPPYLFGKKGGRDDFFFHLKKGERIGGTERLTGVERFLSLNILF